MRKVTAHGRPAIEDLLAALRCSWSRETSGFPDRWTPGNPACGQCTVSALVIQDYLGGEIQRFIVVDQGAEMWHVASMLPDGVLLDSTASQFTSAPVYVPRAGESRESALDAQDTAVRYAILSDRVAAWLAGLLAKIVPTVARGGGDAMRILIVHPGPDFSVGDVYRGWAEALRELGCEVALYNTGDRLLFYSKALIDTEKTDETGHPIVRQAMTQAEAVKAAMQGLSHACYTFWPAVVLFVSGFFVEAGTFALMRQRRHKIVLLHTESPYLPGQRAAAPGAMGGPEPAQRPDEHQRVHRYRAGPLHASCLPAGGAPSADRPGEPGTGG